MSVATGNRTTHVVQADGNDFFAQESRARHVGLGDADRATLTVPWPDGTERAFEGDANRRVRATRSGVEVVATSSR